MPPKPKPLPKPPLSWKKPPVVILRPDGKLPPMVKLPPPDLDQWLAANADIADFIVWERPTTALAQSGPAPWKQWNSGERQQLQAAFEQAWYGQLSTDPTPYPNLVDPDTDDHPVTVLAADVAWQHYRESVATCLASQMQSPPSWSIAKLNPAQKALLLDSRALFDWHDTSPAAGYQPKPWLMPSRPGYMRKVIADHGIFKRSGHKATVVEMVRFCGTLLHFSGSPSTFNFDAHWHYRGYAPVSRIVDGTIPTPTPSRPVQDTEAKRWTPGCYGTTGLMRQLLRTINLPVEETLVCGHTLPYFSSIGRWLSHGDDPYPLRNHPDVSPEKLLVDTTTFEAWFGPGAADPCANVGRRAKELFA